MAPILITFYILFSVVSSIDNLLPIFTVTDVRGVVKVQNYGLGFLIIILVIIISIRLLLLLIIIVIIIITMCSSYSFAS